MAVIDKGMYENLKNWCDYKRPENQFMMYVDVNDRMLTNATIRKLMREIDREDTYGDKYVALYSAQNFYSNMRKLSKKSIEESVNAYNSLMNGIKEAADITLNNEPGKKVRRYTGSPVEDYNLSTEEDSKSVLEILKREYDVKPDKIRGYEKLDKAQTENVDMCKLYRFVVILQENAYTINDDGVPEMTGQAQKEYDEFLLKFRNETVRDTLKIVDEGYEEGEDELEWHITGCIRKPGDENGIAAIIGFEICVRTQDPQEDE